MSLISKEEEYTYSVLEKDTKSLLSCFDFLKKETLGYSALGREIFCLKLGTGERSIFLNGAHHGNEWITSSLLMLILERISYLYKNNLSYGDTKVKDIFLSSSLYVCPMVNPDGVDLSINGLYDEINATNKIKLKSYNSDTNDFKGKWQANINGVDLNHNYNAAFDEGKFYERKLGIFGPCPTRFSGEHPESEPETKAICNFIRNKKPSICIAYHSQGEVIYYDFKGKVAPGAEKIAKNIADVTGYTLDKTDGMASFSGFKDWVISEFSLPAFTIEVGLGKNPLPLSQLDSIFEKNFPAVILLLR